MDEAFQHETMKCWNGPGDEATLILHRADQSSKSHRNLPSSVCNYYASIAEVQVDHYDCMS